jgi:flagellar assembly factor FliW
MEIRCRQLGRIEVEQDDLVEFPQGLVGIEGHQRFAIYRPREVAPLAWLVSLTDPDLTFAIASVEKFAGEPYLPPLGNGDRELLGLRHDETVEVYVLVSPPEGSGFASVNLKGPLIINPRTGLGRQLLLYSARFSSRQTMGPFRLEAAAGGGAKRAA